MTDTHDLTETLATAAAEAVRARRAAIELVLTSAGQVHEAIACVERRTSAGALLARQVRTG